MADPSDRVLVEGVLTGDAAAAQAALDDLVARLRAAGVPAARARTAAGLVAAVHARVREGRPLTADHQRALDGAAEVGVAGAPALGPWLGALRVRTFDEPRLRRLAAILDAAAGALEEP